MSTETTYRPGAIVNGRILSDDGTAWLPLDPDGHAAALSTRLADARPVQPSLTLSLGVLADAEVGAQKPRVLAGG